MFKKYFEKRRNFICPGCGTKITMKFLPWLLVPKFCDNWRAVKCPNCKKRYWMHYFEMEDETK